MPDQTPPPIPDAETLIRPDETETGEKVLLNPNAPSPINEAKWVRAQERFAPDGKAIADPERSEMYDDTNGKGDSGTQSGIVGIENQNPVGRRT